MGVASLRKEYLNLANDVNRIYNGNIVFCHVCNDFHSKESFYADKRYASGFFPECKKSLIKQACDYDEKTKEYKDNKEKTKNVFQKLNIPFIDMVYRRALADINAEVSEVNRQTAYQQTLVIIKSLPQYRGWTWDNSEFDEDEISTKEKEINENSRILKTARKRFGNNYPSNELMWLENEYQDWISKYPVDRKAQEILYKNICLTELNIDKAQREGKETKDLLKTLQELMASLQIKPSQSNSNSLTEAKTFGQLIEKWEDEWDGGKPIPEPDPDFMDIDRVIRYIDTFFKGHLAKMVGLKNAYSRLYDKFITKYTVNKPTYDEDSDSEAIFDQLFGKDGDDL